MKTTCAVEDLDLSLNDIGDEGARAVAGRVKNSSSLRRVNLSSCYIGPDGVRALADAISCDTAVLMNWASIRNPIRSNLMSLFWSQRWFDMIKKIANKMCFI